MVLYGHVINGVYIGDKINLKSFEGKKIKIEIKENKPTRSTKQNNYYWGVVLKYASDEIGHTDDELHEIFKNKFLEPIIKKVKDEYYAIKLSSSILDTSVFSKYVEDIRNFMSAEFNCYIPEPNEEIK